MDRAVIKIKLYRKFLFYINHGTVRGSAEKCFQEDAIKIDGIFIKFSAVYINERFMKILLLQTNS